MQVETYEVTEQDENGQPMECSEEALALIEQLGLEGQRHYLQPKEDGEVERIPYRKMTEEEAFVYETLFPQQTKIENYRDEPIPLRVLQVASHVRECEFFDTLKVWHPKNGDFIEDPLLVGEREIQVRHSETWTQTVVERYILARWGTCLEPFEKLRQMACEKDLKVAVAKAKTAKAEAEQVLAGLLALSWSDITSKLPKASFYNT